MRALAAFIMRGRMQATVVAVLGNLFPFVSPATISLVTLSKGASEGFLLMLWALLPLLAIFYLSDLNAMLTLSSIAGVIVVLIASIMLRLSISWSRMLVFIVAFSGLAALTLSTLFAEQASAFQFAVVSMFQQVQQQSDNIFTPGPHFLLGVIAYIIALTSVVSLMLGRWWQALLYNPGGFQSEFHQLRFGVAEAIILIIGVVFASAASQEYASWAGLLGLPLILSGIALVHYAVAFYQLGSHWLLIFYVALFLLSPLSMVLVGVGFTDSIINIRSRMVRRS